MICWSITRGIVSREECGRPRPLPSERRSCLELANVGMRQLPGVQHQPRRAEPAIAPIAGNGMPDPAQMNADLMRPSRPDLDFDQIAVRANDRDRLFPLDRRIDGQLIDDRRVDAGEVELANLS